MFHALAIPAWIDHPVTRHVLGRRAEGRWARGSGAWPQVVLATAAVAGLVVARELLLPRGTYAPHATAVLFGLMVAPVVAAFATGFYQGTAGLAGLRRDARWRALMSSGVGRGEMFDALCVGLAVRALVLPTFLFQAILVYLVVDGTLLGPTGWRAAAAAGAGGGSGGIDPGAVFFRWLVLGALFAVAAGPVLDYALAVGLHQAAAGRGGAASLVVGAGHLALACVVLSVGFGVFGVVFLVMRTAALRAACRARVEAFTTEEEGD